MLQAAWHSEGNNETESLPRLVEARLPAGSCLGQTHFPEVFNTRNVNWGPPLLPLHMQRLEAHFLLDNEDTASESDLCVQGDTAKPRGSKNHENSCMVRGSIAHITPGSYRGPPAAPTWAC